MHDSVQVVNSVYCLSARLTGRGLHRAAHRALRLIVADDREQDQPPAEQPVPTSEATPVATRSAPQEVADDHTFAGTYTIPEGRLEELYAGIAKMNRLMEKLRTLYPSEQFEPAAVQLGERHFVEMPVDPDDIYGIGFKKQVPYVNVTVTGSLPRLNGWNFVARILHGQDDAGKPMNTFLGVPGKEIPKEYREVGPVCEHCGHNRNRKDTFILSHPEHGVKQVGSSCLADFLGHKSPQQLALCLSYLKELRDTLTDDDEPRSGGRGERYVSATTFDTVAAFLADKFGYTSWKNALDRGTIPTSQIIKVMTGVVRPNKDELREYQRYIDAWKALSDEEKQGYEQLGREAVQHAKQYKDHENPSDFQWNLSAAAHDKAVDLRKMGLRAYIPANLLRERKKQEEMEKQQAEEAEATKDAKPVPYGGPGDAFAAPVTLIGLKPIDSAFGLTMLHRFKDPTGRILSWFASGGAELGQEGETFPIKGKIKKFDNFKGQDQIVITNVKRLEEGDLDENYELASKKPKRKFKTPE